MDGPTGPECFPDCAPRDIQCCGNILRNVSATTFLVCEGFKNCMVIFIVSKLLFIVKSAIIFGNIGRNSH